MGLLTQEKAVIISNGRGVIRTPSTTYLRPSVIRLGYQVRRPRPRIQLTKHEILQRDDYTCQYCGRRRVRMTIDHVVPRHCGGKHTWSNLVTACEDCNRKKGGKLAPEAQMVLLCAPHEPPSSPSYLYRRYLEANQDWVDFIRGW